jgi:hypothetical protein
VTAVLACATFAFAMLPETQQTSLIEED